VDYPAPYYMRIEELKIFLKLEYEYAYTFLRRCLRYTFIAMYTRMGSMDTILGTCLMFLYPFLALASVVLFAVSRKDGHNEKDIVLTYILFCCTTMMHLLFPSCIVLLRIPFLRRFLNRRASAEKGKLRISQCNLISFCVRKNKPTFLMKIATFNFLREFVNQHLYIQEVPIGYQVIGLVRRHVEDGWERYIHDAASYRRFNELRGMWAVRRHRQLGWSFKMPFDESVLIWHIATDLCFYHPSTSPQGRQGEATQRSREISNYMIYLLLTRPEMLMLGTRSGLFTSASDLIGDNVGHSKEELLGMTEEILAWKIPK
jgi:hypothetical protein